MQFKNNWEPANIKEMFNVRSVVMITVVICILYYII